MDSFEHKFCLDVTSTLLDQMIVNTVAKHAGVLLPALAISVHADLNIDHTCTTAQKARLNAAFITAKSVAEKGIIRTDAINTNNLEASEISIEEVHRVNRLMATFFKVGGTDPNYGKALFGIERKLPSPLAHQCPIFDIYSL